LNNNKLINEKLICAFRWSVLSSIYKFRSHLPTLAIFYDQFYNYHSIQDWMLQVILPLDYLTKQYARCQPTRPTMIASSYVITHFMITLCCPTYYYISVTHNKYCNNSFTSLYSLDIMVKVKVKVSHDRPRWPKGFWVG